MSRNLRKEWVGARFGFARNCRLWLLIVLVATVGCANSTAKRSSKRREPPPYSGPAFLRGTIGSMTQFRGFSPLPVSGYGIVVNLNGNGSEVVPQPLRQRMMMMARKRGVKNAERLLADRNTAVVEVRAYIPPGATAGTRFDLLISSLAQTQVLSLDGGALWETELSIYGVDPTMNNRPLATAKGPLFVNPFNPAKSPDTKLPQGVIVGGGVAIVDQTINLDLVQPNYNRARDIADRINERFPKAAARFVGDRYADREDPAEPKSDERIRIHIPKRFKARPERFLNLVWHLYLQRGPNFEVDRVEALAQTLRTQPQQTARIILAWEALGRRAIARLMKYYNDPEPHVQLAALEAAARLRDQRTLVELGKLADHEDPAIRLRVAKLLAHLPGVRGPQTLHRQLGDEDQAVRLAAYESLIALDDPIVQRNWFTNKAGTLKFVLDLVPSDVPLIYIAQSPVPRVVIFNTMLPVTSDRLISMWDNRLMLGTDKTNLMKVFYQQPGQVAAEQAECLPLVANLVYLMGHRSTLEHPMAGFDMTFSQVTNVLYTLHEEGKVKSDLELQINPLARALALQPETSPHGMRPEFGKVTMPTIGLHPGNSGIAIPERQN